MALIKKIFLVSGIVLCFVVILLSSIGVYLYDHPDRVKPMIERSLSNSTGVSCSIETLSYTLKPLVLEAKGVLFKPLKPRQSFSMEIPFIRADMAVKGPWGNRSLILENIRIKGLYLDFYPGWLSSPDILPMKKSPSFLGGVARAFIGLFLFRDIRFQSGELLDGSISAAAGNLTIRADGIHGIAGADKLLSLSFALNVENSIRNMNFTAPNVNILFDKTFDISHLKFDGTLQSQQMRVKGPELGIQRVDVGSKFTYVHSHKNFKFEDLKARFKDIAFSPDVKKTGSLPVSVTAAELLTVETGLTYDMNRQKITFAPLKLHVGGLSMMEKKTKPLSPLDINVRAREISSRYPEIEITDLTAQIPEAKINTVNQVISIGDIRVHIPDGRIDVENKSVILPETRFEALGLKNILLSVRLKKHHLNVAVKGENNGPWKIQANLSFNDLVFQNKNGSIMGENIFLKTGVDSVVDLKHSRITFSAGLDAKTGEALYDRYYLNLKKHPIVTSCNGFWDLKKRLLGLSGLRFDLTGILPLKIQGYLKQDTSKADVDFTATLPQTPVKPIFKYFLQEPYKTEKPFLASLETKGTLSGEFKLKKFQDTWEVKGRIGWLEGFLSLPEKGISLKGIHLDMPVWFRTGLTNVPVKTLKGRLKFQSVMAPLLPEQPLNLPLDSGPNRMSVESQTVIKVPGGDLRFGFVHANNLFGPDFSVQTRLSFDKINLQPLLSRIWTRPLKGSLIGVLDPVRYENHTVTSRGELKAKVFGGRITLSDLGASGIFTLAPVFKFNAKWKNLLLSEMTTDTAFGKIDGVLEGELRNVEMAYGQPQRFNLLLETVRKKGVPQKISIKAVENIAQIGGGQSPFMGLAGAFASFFKTFPYEKIGIRASLENDVFKVNGTIREGDTEYLVKRGGFSGVNIINQNPDNRISFKDMVSRIKRIGAGGGPVVK
ncbi:MAG: hypothetical protein P8012_05040 [Desulfobacterales bacterium]